MHAPHACPPCGRCHFSSCTRMPTLREMPFLVMHTPHHTCPHACVCVHARDIHIRGYIQIWRAAAQARRIDSTRFVWLPTVEQPNIPFEPKGSPAAPTPHKSAPAGRRAVPADAGTNRRSPQPKSKAQLSFGISSRVQWLRGSADAITAGRVGTLRRARRRNRARRQVPRAHYCISKLLYGCRPTSTSPMRTYGSASAHRRCEGSPA